MIKATFFPTREFTSEKLPKRATRSYTHTRIDVLTHIKNLGKMTLGINPKFSQLTHTRG